MSVQFFESRMGPVVGPLDAPLGYGFYGRFLLIRYSVLRRCGASGILERVPVRAEPTSLASTTPALALGRHLHVADPARAVKLLDAQDA